MPAAGTRLPSVRTVEERNALAEQHRGLVFWAVKRFGRPMGLDEEDAVAEGYLALLRAADLWRPDGGSVFSTFAVAGIRLALLRVAKRRERAERCRGIGGYVDPDRNPLDGLDRRAEDPADVAARNEEAARLRQALGTLKRRDRDVILARAEGAGLAEIGGRLGISKERVRQVEDLGLARLYLAMKA